MGYRWRGFEHPVLYKMINSGPGPAASEPQTTYWQSLSEELTIVDQDLNKKLNDLKATWEGAAGESARTGLTPLAAWAQDADTASGVMRISTELQADHVADARAKMPEPVPVTTPAPSGWSMAAAGAAALTGNLGPAVAVAAQAVDHEQQEAAQNEAELRAVETMQTYERSSISNRETLGTFVAPPDVVVSTPPPAAIAGGSVEGGGPRPDGIGGVPTQTTTSSGFTPPTGTASIPTVGSVPGSGGGGGGGGAGGGGGFTVPTVGSTTPQQTTPSSTTLPQNRPPVTIPPILPGDRPGNPPNNLTNNGGNPPFTNNPNLLTNLPNNNQAGRLPVTGLPGVPGGGNPADLARGAQQLRGGLPGGLPGGLGGIDPDSSRASQLGRGPMGGIPGENGAVRTGPGGATAANAARGGGSSGPMGAGGRREDGEDDDEHYAADYLMETDDVFGHSDLRVSPTVIGEQPPQQ